MTDAEAEAVLFCIGLTQAGEDQFEDGKQAAAAERASSKIARADEGADLALRYLDQIEQQGNADIDAGREMSPGFVISNVRAIRDALGFGK